MNRDELIDVITIVFNGVSQPREMTLLVAQTHDDYDYDHEYRQKNYRGIW